MASNKIKYTIDNKYVLYSDKALELIKFFFKTEMSNFVLIDEYKKNSGYWGIKYNNDKYVIFISSGRGYLEYEILFHENVIKLQEVEPLLNLIKLSSENNIKILLNTIKAYIYKESL